VQRLPAEFAPLSVRIVRNSHEGDRRAENLNIGWAAGQGRYLGFLDDDDTLEPGHVQTLIEAMVATGRAWAYSQVTLRKEDEMLALVRETRPFKRYGFSLRDLWEENFLPIHCLLIDRESLVLALRERPFCEDLERSEDWDFLLRLAFHHEPAVVDEFTCTYHVSTGKRNTNLSLIDNVCAADEANLQTWARCKALVEHRKAQLLAPHWWAHEHFGLRPSHRAGGELQLAAPAGQSFRQRALRKLIRTLERML